MKGSVFMKILLTCLVGIISMKVIMIIVSTIIGKLADKAEQSAVRGLNELTDEIRTMLYAQLRTDTQKEESKPE